MDKLKSCGGAAGSARPVSRKVLLLGTALASSLIALPLLTATQARAQVTCPGGNAPINIDANQPIVCINDNDRTNNAGNAIDLETTGNGSYITVDNSGDLTATNNAGDATGLYAYTNDANSPIVINNTGQILVSASDDGFGIYAFSDDRFRGHGYEQRRHHGQFRGQQLRHQRLCRQR